MIVKNEVANLERCLRAVGEHISCWVICDTGSTDSTPDFVREFFAARNIPGELHSFGFENFEQARNRALELARSSELRFDYLLLVDADMELRVADAAALQNLRAPAYYLCQQAGISYWNLRLLQRKTPAVYRGVTHEYLDLKGETAEYLQGVGFIDHATGSNRVDKYERDARLLRAALASESDPALLARYTFYLANTLRDAGDAEAALPVFLHRATLGYWHEEVYVSLLNAARLKEKLGTPDEEVIAAYIDAAAVCPTRAEALHGAARFCRNHAQHRRGYDFAKRGLEIAKPERALFSEDWIYDYGLLDEIAVNAYWAGHYQDSLDANLRILNGGSCPEAERARVEANADFARRKLAALALAERERGRLKIAIYTIALNEAAQVERWVASTAGADYRVVADTGSTDDTVARLAAAGVSVYRIAVRPWRFDDARNACLALLPADADICISLDMDEFMMDGWRASIETAWHVGTTRLSYNYARGLKADGSPASVFRRSKAHSRSGYRWKRIVHEDLERTAPDEVQSDTDALLMAEVQDPGKDRTSYLPLLKLAHEDDAGDSQICFWYGRELMYAGRREESAEIYLRYLALPSAAWAEERAEAMRYLARVRPAQTLEWLQKAIAETPYRRELWLDLAEHYHAKLEWPNVFWASTNGLDRTRRTGSYLDEPAAWNFRLYDLGALACSHLGLVDRAVELGSEAVRFLPDDQRLKNNLGFYKSQMGRQMEASRVRLLAESQPDPSPSGSSLAFNIVRIGNHAVEGIFSDIVDALKLSFIDLGHLCSVTLNAVRPDAINILLGSTVVFARDNALGFLKNTRYVVYQLEPLDWQDGLLPSCKAYMQILREAVGILEYSRKNMAFLVEQDISASICYLPPGFHRVLESFRPAAHADIDVLFIGYLTDRRRRIMESFEAQGINAVHLGTCYGLERAKWLARAKIVLNVHQFDSLDHLETVRLSYLLANRCFVISESSDHDPYSGGVIYAPYERIVDACVAYLGPRAAERSQVAEKGYFEIRRLDMANALRDAIDVLRRVGTSDERR